MLLNLAARNVFREKKNSLSIILLIASITALFFIGNSVAGNGSRGLKRSFIDNITGDVLIQEKGEITMNLFGANTPVIEEFFTVPVLSAHSAIADYLATLPQVESWTSQVSGTAALEVKGAREAALLCGIDADTYFDAFPGIALEDGRFLEAGEFGIMLSLDKARSLEGKTGEKIEIGDDFLLTFAGDAGFKLREAPLVGIFSYSEPQSYLNEVILADAQTVRILSSIRFATEDVALSDNETSLLGQGSSLDDMFGASAFDAGKDGTGASLMDDLFTMLGSEEPSENAAIAEGGDWNFIAVRLKAGVNADSFIKKLNADIEIFGAQAVGWRLAAGNAAIAALIMQMLFNGGVFLVNIACILAVVNILLIAVFKRTKEIGTLRAIGARDNFIRALLLTENCALGIAASVAGLALGCVLMLIVNSLHITIGNELLASILGGATLNIAFSPPLAAISVLAALATSVASSIYPVEIAVRINPIVAAGGA